MTTNQILFEETQVDTKPKKKHKMLNSNIEMDKQGAFLKNYLDFLENFPGKITFDWNS